jgi:DNA polymerase I
VARRDPLDPLYVLDGHFLIFRAYHALPDLRAPDGAPIGAVLGFTQSLLKLIERLRPTLVAVTFDADPIESFRTRLDPAYKQQRGRPAPDLASQFPLCFEAARALGLATALVPDFEADDLMATLVRRFGRRGRPIELLTQDKDLAQLVAPWVTWVSFDGAERLDPAGVVARFGVRPEQIPDYLALVGDSVDNIAGVAGVGPKTARAALAVAPSLDAMLTDPSGLPPAVARGLAADPGRVRLSRRLAELRSDVPLDVTLDALRYRGADAARARALFARLGLARLLDRMLRLGILASDAPG